MWKMPQLDNLWQIPTILNHSILIGRDSLIIIVFCRSMDVFIPNFHSALEVVTNSSSNILETNLKVTFCKTSTDVHNPLLRSFRPRLWFCCPKLWRSKMSASCTQRGTQQRETLPMLSKEESEGVGKALNGGGICRQPSLLSKLEPMWSDRKSSLGLTKMPNISFHHRRAPPKV